MRASSLPLLGVITIVANVACTFMGMATQSLMAYDVPEELKGRTELKGEASMRGHLSAESAEQTGSQSYVPPVEKDDKALGAAYNLLRGISVNADVPSAPKKAVAN